MNTKFRYLVLFICLLAAAVLFFSVKAEIKDGYSVDNGIKAYECEKSIVEEFKGKDREYHLDVLEGEISLLSREVKATTDAAAYIIEEAGESYVARHTDAEIRAESLASLVSEIEADGVTIIFSNVYTEESFAIEKSVILRGSLALKNSSLSLSGDNVTLWDFDLSGENAYVRVKSGETSAVFGKIATVGSSAVVLDFHSGARFVSSGMEISSASQSAAILCEVGSVEIRGGSVSNKYGAAVKNSSSLALSLGAAIEGLTYDVVTERAFSVLEDGGLPSSVLRVKYDSAFEKGSYTVAVRGVTRDLESRVALFDALGEEVALTYFEATKYNDEKNVLAVYLPHTLRLYSAGMLYASKSFIEGEIIAAPEDVKKEGYTFLGWYRDATLKELYTFGTSESSDLSLYAAHSLNAPEFSISSLGFTYDGKKRTLAFDYLYHSLMNEGQFSFVWYKNSEAIPSSASGVRISEVSDSGTYFCKLTFSYCGDFVTVCSPEVRVLVSKKMILKPNDLLETYTGGAVGVNIEESPYFTYEKALYCDVGEYFIELKLRDPSNYVWCDSDAETTTIKLNIHRAENCFLEEPIAEDIYEGELTRVKYSLRFGEGYPEFSIDGETWGLTPPTLAGEYYLRVRSDETPNYTEVVSRVVKFTVFEELCIGIKIDKLPEKTRYLAFETLDLSGAVIIATYTSGKSEEVDLQKIKIEYKSGNSFRVTDSSATIIFLGNSVPIPVEVITAEYDLSGVVFEDSSVTYDGSRHTLSAVCSIIGKDGIELEYKIIGGGIDVGSYAVTLVFSCDSINYSLPEAITRTLSITPMPLSIVYPQTEFIYDGAPKLPEITLNGAFGIPLSPSVSGAATDAGEYTATVTLSDKNYILLNPSVAFKILKADLDLSGVYWSESKFVYSGEAHAVTICGLPRGLSVVGYANASFTNAGSYIAEASVIYDAKNYNSPPRLTHEWTIERAEYDTSVFSFSDASAIYDGEYHYPILSGNMPVGIDGVALEFFFSEGAMNVSEGRKAITVSFDTKSKNYNVPSAIVLYVTVTPMPISVEWEELSFVYDGETHLPAAKSQICKLKITGEGINAGKYTATAEPDSDNFLIINDEISFEITKAYNVWTSDISAKNVYLGDSPSVLAAAIHGEVEYLYYTDASLTKAAILPLSIGEYYAVAVVSESQNYLSLVSEPCSFFVLEILPVELKLEIDEPLFAMRKLTDFSITAYLLNNNGSMISLSPESLVVDYQNGDSLRTKDTAITVSYGEFSAEIPISVSKSIVSAPSLAPVTYNGERIYPEALNSPLFIADFSGAVNAGEYLISLRLTDEENYELRDGISSVTLKILKAPITIRVNKNGSDYEIVEGRLFGEDTLAEEYYEEDGMILLRISNPNYDLTVIPRKEKSVAAYVLLFLLLAIVVILASIGLYMKFFTLEKRTARIGGSRSSAPERECEKSQCTSLQNDPPLETLLAVDESHANDLISDFVAKSLLTDTDEVVETDGKRRCILNLDTISENFSRDECVDINDFKKKGILPEDAKYVKILARGVIDKPIHIRANSFSLAAVKMIALTGGSARRVRTARRKI